MNIEVLIERRSEKTKSLIAHDNHDFINMRHISLSQNVPYFEAMWSSKETSGALLRIITTHILKHDD